METTRVWTHIKRRMGRKPKWTKEAIKASTEQFDTFQDWCKVNHSAYQIASRNGWLLELSGHLPRARKPHGYWTKERIKESTVGHTHYRTWYTTCHTVASLAHIRGWTDEVSGHLIRAHRTPRLEFVTEESAVCANYRPLLEKIAVKIVGPEFVDDVVSDSIIQGMLCFNQFDSEKGKLATWLGRVCLNVAKKWYVNNKNRGEYVENLDVIDEEEDEDAAEILDDKYNNALALIRQDEDLIRFDLVNEFVEYMSGQVKLCELAERLKMGHKQLQGLFTRVKNRLIKQMKDER